MLRKHTKAIAACLLFIFYANFVGAVYVSMKTYSDINNRRIDYLNSGYKISTNRAISKNNNTPLSVFESNKKEIFNQPTNSTIEDDNSGPSQPEMATFKSVSADNMVNLFTGDFSYNIPLLDVGGYPINIFYNGGITMDQDASWVGLGWNINPGTITRNMRGLPDDFDGTDQITKTQKVKPEISLGASYGTGVEVVGFGLTPSTSVTYGVFYNTTKGMGLEIGGSYGQKINLSKNSKDEKTGYDASYKVSATLNSQEGLTVNPTFGIGRHEADKYNRYGLQVGTSYNSMMGISSLQVDAEAGKYFYALKNTLQETGVSSRGAVNINFAKPSYTPTIRMPVNRANFTADFKWGKTDIFVNRYKEIKGYYSKTEVSPIVQTRPAYGYLNLEKGNSDDNALLDFNRINDNVFTPETPAISFPYYTYDIFSIAGEGTGGTFRAYRNNIGFVTDPYTLSTSNSGSLGVELSQNDPKDAEPQLHVGVDIDAVYTPTTIGNWSDNNTASSELAFQKSNGYKEAAYFKNPGEKAIVSNDYFNAVGGDMISRLKLFDPGNTRQPQVIPAFENFELDAFASKNLIGTQPITANTACRNTRDKRSQIITYLNAEEASRVGLDRYLYSYEMNNFFDVLNANKRRVIGRVTEGFAKDNYRKKNHISEIDVLEPDGKRYVYGIPVYNTFQKDVSFAVKRPDIIPNDGIITYQSDGVTPKPYDNSKDQFYQSEEIPGYAHSFLLTALLSPDYVDVTGNGISDDDLGDAIKFNYTRLNYDAFGGNWANYKWRTPFTGVPNQAIYNEALKTDKSDDKASYTYGERESWYMHSIESKNMIAVFHLSDRHDNFQPNDELGNAISSTVSSVKLLDRIDLFSRAELLKNNGNAKPIKTVNFVYDYSLCKGTPTNSNHSEGKLTLKQIYFTYNGNNRQHKGAYIFDYDQDNTTSNPNYTRNSTDRWGTYKNALNNPVSIANPDYPFTIQNQSDNDAQNRLNNDQAAASWNLRKILLPSGSQIEIDYEADDYGYVQSKRASQMFQIVGFGGSSSATPEGTLAPHIAFWKKNQDYDYVFIDIPHPLSSTTPSMQREEIRQYYIDEQKQLAFKLWVAVRNDILTPDGSDNLEPINVYADIEDWGGVSNTRIWIKVKRLSDNSSPILTTVIQFLKNNLNSKAYPSSYVDPNANVGLQTIRAIAGMVTRLIDVFTGLETRARMNSGLCSNIPSSGGKIKGFVRLANPYFKKIGGGYRVKEVRIRDNWGKMLDGSNNNKTSTYGQHYYYTTKTNILGNDIEISSGVATYEPMIGAEENPFKEVLNYDNKSLPLGPTDRGFVDMPLCESFFPSASVGYSKVTVKSIHQNTNTTKYKSGIGSQITEYYTSKEFPYFSDYTPLDPSSYVRYKRDPILEFLKIDMNDMVTLSQGFRVRLNDMNGKMKSQSSFAEDDPIKPITYTEYFYKTKKIGNEKYKLNNDNISVANKNGVIISQTIGKDIEVMTDFREHRSITSNTSLLVNTEGFMIGPIPAAFPVWFSPPLSIISTFRSASVLKIINEYAILDRVLHIDKGSSVTTKNLVYDAETGETLITETQNNFNNSVFSFNYPAHWAYQGMEMAYKNIDVRLDNIKFRNGIIETAGVDMNMFESGDEIYVFDDANRAMPNTRACYKEGDPLFMPQLGEYKVWAVDIAKDSRNTAKSFIFIDKYGIPFNSVGTNIRIVRSGKRNMITANVGSVTSFNSPIVGSNIVINNNTKVLNASAVEYKEKWKAEDGFYPVYENTLIDYYAPLHTNVNKSVTSIYTYEEKRWHCGLWGTCHGNNLSHSYFQARAWDDDGGDDYNSQSFATFNLNDVGSTKKIVSAKLSLYSHSGNGVNFNIHPDYKLLTNDHNCSNPHKASQYPYSNNFWIQRTYFNPTSYPFGNTVVSSLHAAYGQINSIYGYQASTKSFCSTCDNGNDNRLDVTNLIKDMHYDKYVNNRTGEGIKIVLGEPGGKDFNHEYQERRVCFSSGFQSVTNPLQADGAGPELDIKYYEPSEVVTNTIPSGEYYHYQDYNWQTNCHSFFERTQMNPYQLGLLGNWRVSKNYVFYGDRIKKDVTTTQTDIQHDGIIDNFNPYWTILSGVGGLTPNTATPNKWVWNSQISLVNKKGFEVENYDALMRFNSGVYGYNNNLPIAVANNAKYRETGFDGFEDYGYKDRGQAASSACIDVIKDSARHWKLGVTDANLTTDASHTGINSVKVNANSNYTFTSKVMPNNAPADPDVKLEMLDLPYTDVQPSLPGTGLTGYYYNGTGFSGSVIATRGPELPYLDFEGKSGRGGVFGAGACDFCCVRQYPMGTPNGVHCVEMSTKWFGWIFLEDNGDYDFAFQVADDWANVKLTNSSGSIVLDCPQVFGQPQNVVTAHNLTQGFYKIEVDYLQKFGGGIVKLLWKTPTSTTLTQIPKTVLFPNTSSEPAHYSPVIHCIKPGTIQGVANAKLDQFSIIQGSKMVISTWVKVGGNDCKCSSYEGKTNVQISFTGDGTMPTLNPFTPSGNIINGWQRLECVFDVPATAKGMTVSINNTTGNLLYFDDLRIHPYNANMKSFVYDPVTLRLMAELDENNYASFYEYDNDGTLTRVKKETKEGIKTIKETRSALQKSVSGIQ